MDVREKLIKIVREKATELPGLGVSATQTLRFVDHLIANGVTVQEWISVKDRLPEESGKYLAYCGEYDGICVLYCEVLKTKIKWHTKWKEVTHWMPLPQPPKGE